MADVSPAVSRPVTMRVSFACDPAEVRSAVGAVRTFLAGEGVYEGDLTSCELALVEACNNAVKYAEEAGRARPIVVETIAEPAQIELRVSDHTPGFNWPEKILLPAPESERGRGLYLMTSLMDHAAYFRGHGENILVLRKKRSASPPTRKSASKGRHIPQLPEHEQIIGEMVEELSSCYESLSAIFRYSSEQGKNGASLKDFAQRLFGDLMQIISAEWFILRLISGDGSKLELFAASEPELGSDPLVFPKAGQPARATEVQAARARQAIWFDSENPFSAGDAAIKPGSEGVVHPIVLGEQLVGTIALGRTIPPKQPLSPGQAPFSAAQTNVLNTFADFLAIQIVNAKFQEEQLKRRLVTHELEIANNIQRSLLLTTLPQVAGFSLAAFCRSAHEVGGDFYDVLRVDEHSLLLIIADVMGKGIPAALFAAILRALLRAAPELTHRPSALLTRVNRLLFPELSGVDMFITAQLAYVDAQKRSMVAASAGHCPLALATAEKVKTISPEGMPLGILPNTVFQEETVDLPENCRVLLYTDGLTDALNARREPFGEQRLMEWLARTATSSGNAEQFKDELIRGLGTYQANTPLNDDQTFLMMSG